MEYAFIILLSTFLLATASYLIYSKYKSRQSNKNVSGPKTPSTSKPMINLHRFQPNTQVSIAPRKAKQEKTEPGVPGFDPYYAVADGATDFAAGMILGSMLTEHNQDHSCSNPSPSFDFDLDFDFDLF